MDDQISKIDLTVLEEWRELGFYYDLDERSSAPIWIFYGSRDGFERFASLLIDYAQDPVNEMLSEHEHYGPYHYLKVTTSIQNRITKEMFEVTIPGAVQLAELIRKEAHSHLPGQTFSIDADFGLGNTASTLFFIMDDNFDPPTLDSSLQHLTLKL